MAPKVGLVPPPPTTVDNVNPYAPFFDELMPETKPPATNPYSAVFDSLGIAAPQQQVPTTMPQPMPAAPVPAPSAPPDPTFTFGMPAPLPLTEGAPLPPPSLGNQVMGDIGQAVKGVAQSADKGAGNLLNWLNTLGPMGQQIVQQGFGRAQEEKANGPLEKLAASVIGIAHGPMQMAQDAYNATIAQSAHGNPATFANDFLNLPGIRKVNEAMPTITNVASQGGGMALPVAGPEMAVAGAVKGLPLAAQIAAKTAAGAAGGALYGRIGQMGQDYGTYGAVDPQAANEATGQGALLGGGLSLLHMGAEGAGHAIAGAQEKARINKVTNATPAGERNIADLLSPAEKAKLGINIKKPEAAPAAPKVETKVSGQIIDTTKQPTPVPVGERKTYDFLGTEAKQQLEQRDAQEASNPFAKINNIKDFTDAVTPAMTAAEDLPSLMQAKENATKWIGANIKDKEIKTQLSTTLDQAFNGHKQELARKRENAHNQQILEQQGPAPEFQPKEAEIPADLQTKHYEDTNFPGHNMELGDYDFGTFNGTLDKQYHKPYGDSYTPKMMPDSAIEAHLSALDGTEKSFNKAYETADKNTRGRITGMKNKIELQRKGLLSEKMRREYRKIKGLPVDWPVEEGGQPEGGQPVGQQDISNVPEVPPAPENFGQKPGQEEAVSQAPPEESLTKAPEPIDYTKLSMDELAALGPEHLDAANSEINRRFPVDEPAVEATPKTTEMPVSQAPELAPPAEHATTPEPAPVAAPEQAPPAVSQPEPTPEIPEMKGETVWEGDKVIVKKNGAFYQTFDKATGEKLYSGNGGKDRNSVIASAGKKDRGEVRGSQGQRTDRAAGITLGKPNSYQADVAATGTDLNVSGGSPELKGAFDRLASAARAMHTARAEYRAWENAYRRDNGLSLKKDAVRVIDKEAEAAMAAASKDLNTPVKNLGLEVNTSTPPDIPQRAFKPGENREAVIYEKWQAFQKAQKDFEAARKAAHELMIKERGDIPYSINHSSKGFKINARFLGKGELAPKFERSETELEPSHNFKEVQQHIKANDEPIAQVVESEPETKSALGAFVDTLKKEFSDLPNDTVLAATDWGLVGAGVIKIYRALKAAGQHFDPRGINHLLMNELNSDKYARMAHPQFYAGYKEFMGKLDLALQGVEKLHTAEEREAWMKNRYSDPSDIRAGVNGTNRLTPAQREALIKQNNVLNDMTDLWEQYAQVLRNQGYQGNGPKSLIGKNNLLRTLETDLKQLDARRYRGNTWLDELGKGVTHGIYDMYITGNWPVHQLHAIEASSVGLAYHPKAFASAVKDLTGAFTGTGSKVSKEFSESFEGSSGNMKRIKEENDTAAGNWWRNVQKGALDGTAKLFGISDASEKLAHNPKAQLAGDILEGSIAETAKLHLMRTMSAHIAADEMGYHGGAEQLMRDMTEALHNPNAMTPDDQLEAASRIAYHMNQMIGYSPAGFNDLNVFGRLTAKTGPLMKWISPFTTTRITQSRVLTKFFTNAAQAAKAGDKVAAARGVGQGLTMLGLIALIGGRAGVPREIQDALHKADPKAAKDILETADHLNFIGSALGTEVEHVTPQLMVPAYLGDNFMTQILKSGVSATDSKHWNDARNIAFILAMAGMGSIGDRMGSSAILKLAKAVSEGTAGEKTAYAARLTNTLDSVKHTTTVTQRALNKLGVNIKAPNDSDIIASEVLPANPISRLWDTVKTGVPLDAAHFINAARDDYAFADKLRSMDQSVYEAADRQLHSIRRGAQQQIDRAKGDKEKIREIRERTAPLMQGYWERTFEQYMQRKQRSQSNGREETTKATPYAETGSVGRQEA